MHDAYTMAGTISEANKEAIHSQRACNIHDMAMMLVL